MDQRVIGLEPPDSKHHSRTSNSISSVQFSSVAQSCPTLCEPMNSSTPGLPVHHKLPEFTQTYVHRVGDAITEELIKKCRISGCTAGHLNQNLHFNQIPG